MVTSTLMPFAIARKQKVQETQVHIYMNIKSNVVVKYTLPPEMFGAFGSVWCKMALGEVGLSLP